jgi:hypothetical protein
LIIEPWRNTQLRKNVFGYGESTHFMKVALETNYFEELNQLNLLKTEPERLKS